MVKPLTQLEISQALTKLPRGRYKNNELSKDFSFSSFHEALSFIVRVGIEAEELNHHPKIINVYTKVMLRLNTHDAGNKVTYNNVELAQRIDFNLKKE